MIPDFQTLMFPLLQLLADKKVRGVLGKDIDKINITFLKQYPEFN